MEREEADAMQTNVLNVVFYFQSCPECHLLGVWAGGPGTGFDLAKGWDGQSWGCPPPAWALLGVFSEFGQEV